MYIHVNMYMNGSMQKFRGIVISIKISVPQVCVRYFFGHLNIFSLDNNVLLVMTLTDYTIFCTR